MDLSGLLLGKMDLTVDGSQDPLFADDVFTLFSELYLSHSTTNSLITIQTERLNKSTNPRNLVAQTNNNYTMKTSNLFSLGAVALSALAGVDAFAPTSGVSTTSIRQTQLSAKYNTMDEILALFPEDKPVVINFYDANTEGAIKGDIFKAKQLLEDRAKFVSIKQQDYPDLVRNDKKKREASREFVVLLIMTGCLISLP